MAVRLEISWQMTPKRSSGWNDTPTRPSGGESREEKATGGRGQASADGTAAIALRVER